MKKQGAVETVSKTIRGHDAVIEIFRTRAGYHGQWHCLNCDCFGSSSKIQPTIELAILTNELNAATGLGAPCTKGY